MDDRASVTHFARGRSRPGARFVRAACGCLFPGAADCADPSCPVCRQAIGVAGRRRIPAPVPVGLEPACPGCQESRLIECDAGLAVCLVCSWVWRL
jgi:hypothetical protein